MNWKWLNPLTWFAKKSFGVFVRVHMDAEFGNITECRHLEDLPHFLPTLHITDLDFKDAEQLTRHKINWHEIPMHMRSDLELGGRLLRVTWDKIRPYLEQK